MRASMNMCGPQMAPWVQPPSGPCGCGPCNMTPSWIGSQFPPTPPSTPRSTMPYPRTQALLSSQCPPTQPCTPSISPSQPRSTGSSPMQSSPAPHTHEAPRVYGFDLNTSWQPDKDHYDNQKINGLTLPRSIRPSAFTQKLDIEGCDPLSLPVAALMYQQANNHWIRRLAHGRELYLIPTADIAAVVFMAELLQQLKARGVDLDRVSSYKARQDGKVLDKTTNTKYAAQQVAEIIQGWLPARVTDPESQQEITQLRNQVAQL